MKLIGKKNKNITVEMEEVRKVQVTVDIDEALKKLERLSQRKEEVEQSLSEITKKITDLTEIIELYGGN